MRTRLRRVVAVVARLLLVTIAAGLDVNAQTLFLDGASTLAEESKSTIRPSHVRSEQVDIEHAIRIGVLRSATFGAIVEELNASDVVAYVESSPRMRQGLNGYLNHRVVISQAWRLVRIRVRPNTSTNRLVSTIAHELQHAVEVARDPRARSYEAMDRLFRSLDSGRCIATCMETFDAERVQEEVLRELAKP